MNYDKFGKIDKKSLKSVNMHLEKNREMEKGKQILFQTLSNLTENS